jgi:dCMP deaminase
MFMEIAHIVAKRATCQRLSVGAVLVAGRSIVSIGYNGVPAGHPHCSGNNCPGRMRCELAVHAEINAIRHLPFGTKGPLDMYCTDSPCADCYAELITDARVARILFSTPYRISDHLMPEWGHGEDQIDRQMPEVYRITSSGYITDWRRKELVEIDT